MPLPKGYPHELNDEQLAQALSDLMSAATVVTGETDFSDMTPELQLAVVEAGLLEESIRQAGKAERQARRVAWISLGVAALALGIALVFGVLAYRANESWHDEQLRILIEIRDLLR